MPQPDRAPVGGRQVAGGVDQVRSGDTVGSQGSLDDFGTFGVAMLTYVSVVVEALHPRWPTPERPTVLIEPQHLAAAQVADLYRVSHEVRGLRFRAGGPLARAGEGALGPGGEKFDFCVDRGLGLRAQCGAHRSHSRSARRLLLRLQPPPRALEQRDALLGT
jgi:hypothetical protein